MESKDSEKLGKLAMRNQVHLRCAGCDQAGMLTSFYQHSLKEAMVAENEKQHSTSHKHWQAQKVVPRRNLR